MPFATYDMDPANTSTNGIAQAQTTGGAANLVLNGSQVSGGVWSTTSAGYSSGVGGVRILIDSAGDVSSVIFTVTGTDQDGIARTEAITGVTTTEVVSTTFWQTISQIAASAAVGSNVNVGTTNQIISPTFPTNWRNNYPVSMTVTGLTGTCQYDIEETMSPWAANTDPTTLLWAVSQSNKSADLAVSALNYSTGIRLRFDSYTNGAELQFSLRQNDYST